MTRTPHLSDASAMSRTASTVLGHVSSALSSLVIFPQPSRLNILVERITNVPPSLLTQGFALIRFLGSR